VRSPEEHLISRIVDAVYDEYRSEDKDGHEDEEQLYTMLNFSDIGEIDLAGEKDEEPNDDNTERDKRTTNPADESDVQNDKMAAIKEADTVQVVVGSRKAESIRRAAVNHLAFIDVEKLGLERMRAKKLGVSTLRKQKRKERQQEALQKALLEKLDGKTVSEIAWERLKANRRNQWQPTRCLTRNYNGSASLEIIIWLECLPSRNHRA
jgi:hypothetical protein